MNKSNRAALGINLLWLALILDGLGVVFTYFRVSTIPFVQIVLVLIEWLVITRIAGGHNWARILYLVLTILEVTGMLLVSGRPGMPSMVLGSGLEGIVNIATPIIRVLGIGILFTPPAAEWFRSGVR